jgi:hypothetical protein
MRRSNSNNNDSDGSDVASPISHSNIKDFMVLNKLGKLTKFILLNYSIGTGAFSDVFRAKRISDGIEYALKKVINKPYIPK